MAYLGNAPARSFISFERQVFTIVNSQTAYTLSHSVNNENDIRLVINNIVQEPGSGKAYTASGTTLTLSAALTNGTDEMYCVFLGRAVGTVNAPAGSVGSDQTAPTVITGQTAETSIATDDTILIHDTSASALRKMTRANFVSGIGGDNLPVFAVSKSGGSNQTISHGSYTKVTFSNEITDPSSAFASDKFTVPSGKGGTYLFAWNLQIEDSDSAIVRMITQIYKNGSGVSSAQMRSEGGDTVFANYTISQTRILTASAGDYFEVYVYQESSNGSSVILEASTNHNQYFSGTKLIT